MQLIRVVSILLLVKMAASLCGVDPEVMEQEEILAVQANYDREQAMNIRLQNHFFCINRTTENNATNGAMDVMFDEFEQNNESIWTLFFQLPALSYLDPARKTALLQIVLNTLNLPGAGQTPIEANPPRNLEDLCIGTFEFYELTTFRESVLFHLYRRTEEFTASQVASQFDANVATAYQDGNNQMVIAYPGQPNIIAFNLSAMMMLQQDEILLPFRMTQDGADPTSLAVYLGSFPMNMTIADLQASESFSDIEDRFAENPNPVNYGLEAGDIVFAVLGGILLLLLSFIILLGYCIHPFWLA